MGNLMLRTPRSIVVLIVISGGWKLVTRSEIRTIAAMKCSPASQYVYVQRQGSHLGTLFMSNVFLKYKKNTFQGKGTRDHRFLACELMIAASMNLGELY